MRLLVLLFLISCSNVGDVTTYVHMSKKMRDAVDKAIINYPTQGQGVFIELCPELKRVIKYGERRFHSLEKEILELNQQLRIYSSLMECKS